MLNVGKCTICKLVGLLLILGGINWGLVGLMDMNLVNLLLGGIPMAEKIVYILIGLSGVVGLISMFKSCPCVKK